jgi:hypothetical protein
MFHRKIKVEWLPYLAVLGVCIAWHGFIIMHIVHQLINLDVLRIHRECTLRASPIDAAKGAR